MKEGYCVVGSFWVPIEFVGIIQKNLINNVPTFISHAVLLKGKQGQTVKKPISLLITHGNSSGNIMGMNKKYGKPEAVIEQATEGGVILQNTIYVLNCFNGRTYSGAVFNNTVRVVPLLPYWMDRLVLSETDPLGEQHISGNYKRIFIYGSETFGQLFTIMREKSRNLLEYRNQVIRDHNLYNRDFYSDMDFLIEEIEKEGVNRFFAGYKREDSYDEITSFIIIIPCYVRNTVYSMRIKREERNSYVVTIKDEKEERFYSPNWQDRRIDSVGFQFYELIDVLVDLYKGKENL